MTDVSADVSDDLTADVVVAGDGPAGSALSAALVGWGVDVALVGPDDSWAATYTTWADDIEGLDLLDGVDPWAHRFDRISVRFDRAHVVERAYGVIDNAALRAHLRTGVRHVPGVVIDPARLNARLVVDATGWPSKLHADDGGDDGDERRGDGDLGVRWQTAFGVLLETAPDGDLATPTMMDYSDPGVEVAGRPEVATFAYSLPVAEGWLVEETVLTASPAVEPEALLAVLAARLRITPAALLERAVATETVRIPMGVAIPERESSGPVRFGAAAGMVHPATGYSVASALRGADVVAASIEQQLHRAGATGSVDADAIRSAVWSPDARRTRQLHDYGHDVLADLDRTGVNRFFDTFFELPVDVWSPYLRIDTPPRQLAVVMAKMFANAPWALRWQLMTGDLRRFARMLRP